MNRNVFYGVLIVTCLVVAVVVTVLTYGRGRGAGNAELQDVIQRGHHIRVICASAECGHADDDFRAHSYDRAWPKACPACGQKTLCRAVRCHKCTEYTAWHPDAQGRVYCSHCKTWLNPPPETEAGEGSPAAP